MHSVNAMLFSVGKFSTLIHLQKAVNPGQMWFGARFYTGNMEHIKGLLRSAIITSAACASAAVVAVILIG